MVYEGGQKWRLEDAATIAVANWKLSCLPTDTLSLFVPSADKNTPSKKSKYPGGTNHLAHLYYYSLK
jgi:hypothetical protein